MMSKCEHVELANQRFYYLDDSESEDSLRLSDFSAADSDDLSSDDFDYDIPDYLTFDHVISGDLDQSRKASKLYANCHNDKTLTDLSYTPSSLGSDDVIESKSADQDDNMQISDCQTVITTVPKRSGGAGGGRKSASSISSSEGSFNLSQLSFEIESENLNDFLPQVLQQRGRGDGSNCSGGNGANASRPRPQSNSLDSIFCCTKSFPIFSSSFSFFNSRGKQRQRTTGAKTSVGKNALTVSMPFIISAEIHRTNE